MQNRGHFQNLKGNLAKALATKRDLKSLKSCFDDGLISLKVNDNVSSVEYLTKINRLFDIILSITNNPKLNVISEDVIVLANQVTSLTNETFAKTIKNPSLWKRKDNGKMIPFEVHSFYQADSIDIYENRFVIFCYNSVMDELKKMMQEGMFSSYSLQRLYQTTTLTFGEDNFLKDLLTRQNDISNLLFTNNLDDEDILLSKVYKKGKRISYSEFYKILSKKDLIANVMQTNILLHEQRYSYVYRFYKDRLSERANDGFIAFATLKIVKEMIDNDYDFSSLFKVQYRNNSLKFYSFIASKDSFVYSFSLKKNLLTINVFHNNFQTKNLVVLEERLDEKTIYQGYDNVFYLTLENGLQDYNNVFVLTNEEKTNSRVEDLLKTLRIKLDYPREDVVNCFICGSSKLEEVSNGNYCCKNCHSTFALIKKAKTTVWIKSFWGNYGR